MSEKSVLHKARVLKWRHNRSQSPVFGLEVKFVAFGASKHREGKSLSKIFFAIFISTLGRFNQATKKNLSYTLLISFIIKLTYALELWSSAVLFDCVGLLDI